MMLGGVPNLALALGYTNASWTLKCDLVAEYVCRLISHMDAPGYGRCLPLAPGPSVAVAAPPDLRPRHPHAPPRRGRGRGNRVHPPPGADRQRPQPPARDRR